MSASDDVKTKAARMTLGALAEKVNNAADDCVSLGLLHADLVSKKYTSEAADVARQHKEACAWSTVGLAELEQRQIETAPGQATAAAATSTSAAASASRRRKTPKAPDPATAQAPLPSPPSSALPWVAGAAAVGVGLLAILGMRKPSVVRYVKAIPVKATKAAKKVTKKVLK